MLEVEVKYAEADFARMEEQLHRGGASLIESRRDADSYFNAPDRDFASTNEAFRLRAIGERNCITYKGPKIDTETKTREELELPLPDGPVYASQFQALLVHLGYQPVAVVKKLRRVYGMPREGFDLQVCLDDVDEVGRYVEIEIVSDLANYPKAKAVILATASELGLTQQERRSYLNLLLAARGQSR